MGKYDPLAHYLNSYPDNTWTATFSQVEKALGFTLPRSARQHRAWWANEKVGNHSQSAGWQEAGWETREVDLRNEIVKFERCGRPVRRSAAASASAPPARNQELWRVAATLTGIEDRDVLIEAALTALMQQYSARQLAALGGSMPDFAPAPRERTAT